QSTPAARRRRAAHEYQAVVALGYRLERFLAAGRVSTAPAARLALVFLAGSRADCLPSIGSSISRCPSIRLRPFFGCAGLCLGWAVAWRSPCTLRRKASMRLITFAGSRSLA